MEIKIRKAEEGDLPRILNFYSYQDMDDGKALPLENSKKLFKKLRKCPYLVEGMAVALLDGREIPLQKGEVVDIPKRTWHRIMNPGKTNMAFSEVQRGLLR